MRARAAAMVSSFLAEQFVSWQEPFREHRIGSSRRYANAGWPFSRRTKGWMKVGNQELLVSVVLAF
jgi:hypothetical protein